MDIYDESVTTAIAYVVIHKFKLVLSYEGNIQSEHAAITQYY